jgi:hypothetical protein
MLVSPFPLCFMVCFLLYHAFYFTLNSSAVVSEVHVSVTVTSRTNDYRLFVRLETSEHLFFNLYLC